MEEKTNEKNNRSFDGLRTFNGPDGLLERGNPGPRLVLGHGELGRAAAGRLRDRVNGGKNG